MKQGNPVISQHLLILEITGTKLKKMPDIKIPGMEMSLPRPNTPQKYNLYDEDSSYSLGKSVLQVT